MSLNNAYSSLSFGTILRLAGIPLCLLRSERRVWLTGGFYGGSDVTGATNVRASAAGFESRG